MRSMAGETRHVPSDKPTLMRMNEWKAAEAPNGKQSNRKNMISSVVGSFTAMYIGYAEVIVGTLTSSLWFQLRVQGYGFECRICKIQESRG